VPAVRVNDDASPVVQPADADDFEDSNTLKTAAKAQLNVVCLVYVRNNNQ
jgi:hypothetical protein